MINRFLVYGHYTSDTNELFYIGEGTLKRAHTSCGRNIYWKRKASKHNGFKVKIFSKDMTKHEATRLESKMIKALKKRGYKLTNILDSTICKYWKERPNPRLAQWNKDHSGILSPVYGLKRPDLSERNKTGSFKRFVKPVRCIELDKIFNSVQEANIYFGKVNSTHITQYIKGQRKTAHKHTWEYVTVA